MNSDQIGREILKMKRAILIVLGAIALCSLCLAGIVSAAKEGYGFRIANGELITTDGAVNPATEWDDSYKDWLYDGWTMTTNFFRTKWQGAPVEAWLIEILTDTTNDAGDNYQMAIDTAVDGGAAPQADDSLINWTGGTMTLFAGTGTAWGTSSGTPGTDAIISSTFAASPASATPHRIIELWIDKAGAFAMAFSNNMRMSYYDAGTGQTFMWPPLSSADQPDTYGTGTTEFGDPIPEGLTVGVILTLSTGIAIVSIRYFRKQPKL